jgi:hypothetical protein
MDVKLSIHLKILVYHLLQHFTSNQSVVRVHVNQLIELEENCRKAFDQLIDRQQETKSTFDKRARERLFEVGDLVLI